MPRTAIISLILTLLGGCYHTGAGQGFLANPCCVHTTEKLRISWRSAFDAGAGQMRAELPDHQVYAGPFQQVRARIDTDITGARFAGWSYPDWAADAWYGGPPRSLKTGVNSPMVVARLTGPSGEEMRCKFQLRGPDAGMAGGATGECLLPARKVSAQVEVPRTR